MANETAQLFAAAIEKIDADIAATEARLADLRRKRQTTEELKDYFDLETAVTIKSDNAVRSASFAGPVVFVGEGGVGDSATRTKGWGENSHHAIVRKLIAKQGWTNFHTREATKLADENGLGFTARQVSNALSRLRYDGWLEAVPSRGKGQWHVVDSENTDGPAEAGPSDDASHPFEVEVKAG